MKRLPSTPKRWAVVLLFALCAACADEELRITGCEPAGDIEPICGIKTPEDMAALPDGRHLLLAHFGGMGQGTGSISLFDTEERTFTPLFPEPGAMVAEADWGSPDCAVPDLDIFSPHGTHLHQLDDGTWRFLVVNHGGLRESIDLFEVTGAGAGTRLQWRGCVEPAADTVVNDVVGLANGDLVYTRMLPSQATWHMLTSILGFDTGELWRWSADSGVYPIPGTEANQPNGIEISADSRYLFANMYMTGEVWKVDVDTGEILGRAPVPSGDNSAWGPDGRLWVVTHNDSLASISSCFYDKSLTCGLRFDIFAIDPDTMAHELIYSHRGPPMGAATIAVAQNGRVWMGSFAGDRMVSVPVF